MNATVTYKQVDGAHFFVAANEAALGLCLAHSDLSVAYSAVGPELEKLFYLNQSKSVEIKPPMSAVQFAHFVEKLESAADDEGADVASNLHWKVEEALIPAQ